MGRYILKRLGQTAVVILILSFLVFMLVSMLPGDPVYAMLGGEISQETYQRWYQALNLDKPIIVRYFLWLWNAIRLDFGVSASYHMPVVDVLAERIPTTLYFSLLSFVISIPIGILLGILSAIHRGKKTDTIVTMTANITCCLPQFWLSVLFLYIFFNETGLASGLWIHFTYSGFCEEHETDYYALNLSYPGWNCFYRTSDKVQYVRGYPSGLCSYSKIQGISRKESSLSSCIKKCIDTRYYLNGLKTGYAYRWFCVC